MSELRIPHNVFLADWVRQARPDPVRFLERQVTEILLHAIGITASLNKTLVLKGGVLMSLAHGSFRQTGDVDFTAIVDPEPYASLLKHNLNLALTRSSADLGYLDLLSAVQRFDYTPRRDGFEDMNAPALRLSIGYAKVGTSDAQRLKDGQSSRVLQVDISFKEKVIDTQNLTIEEPNITIQAYSFEEIIAEKLRATLQQAERNRSRRQDVFDIRWLIERYRPDLETIARIHAALLAKSENRNITPFLDSFDNPEIKARSASEWESMRLEIGGRLPNFDETFEIVRQFYRSMPWTK
jgi:hypothetical protein